MFPSNLTGTIDTRSVEGVVYFPAFLDLASSRPRASAPGRPCVRPLFHRGPRTQDAARVQPHPNPTVSTDYRAFDSQTQQQSLTEVTEDTEEMRGSPPFPPCPL
jgi:hypothetical protein